MGIVSLVMFILLIPTLLVLFCVCYPKNWKKQKLVLGVRNREEYRSDDIQADVDAIYLRRRQQARNIVIVCSGIAVVLLVLYKIPLLITIWSTLFIVSMFALHLPFIFGNREMKDLKRRLGLNREQGVTYVDLSNAGTVHALNRIRVIIPNIVGALLVIVSVLVDLKVIVVSEEGAAGSFLATMISCTFLITGVLIAVLAVVMDNLRNEVISVDSAVNANYNRAKKKNTADFVVLLLWLNTVYLAIGMISMCLWYSGMLAIIGITGYILLIAVGMVMYFRRMRKVESRYEKEISVAADDDDLWIAGLFYYNPQDKRLNVEKRVGMGGTVNIAHPVGKILTAVIGLVLAGTLAALVWVGMLEITPAGIRVENDRIICHQLRDDYVIEASSIRNVEWGEDIEQLKLIRVSGVGMDNLLKGNFTVNGENGCAVFLTPEAGHYIVIDTADKKYYISDSTAEGTKEAFASIEKLKK